MASAVVEASGDPPLGALYHCKLVPVAVRFATVGLVLLQNVCGLVAEGGVVETILIDCENVATHPNASVTCKVIRKFPKVE